MVEDYARVTRNRLITLQVISCESHVFVLQSPCQHFTGTWSNNTLHEMIRQLKFQVLGLSSKDILQEIGR